tara:strand:+ start:14680 stop:15378 length:699 start_codon:yes stop_codon:yes gene_type:complete
MKVQDIFKMEIYKNRNDKPYLLVIAILTIMTSISTFIAVGMIENKIDGDKNMVLLVLINIFSAIGLSIFSLHYPFRLLNMDYKNKVMSLIFASGVSREKYYFVKISASILTCLIATLVILLVPALTFLTIYIDEFVKEMQYFLKEFRLADIFPLLTMLFFWLIAYYVTLTTAVIITKGKIVGILLFFGFYFVISIVQSMIGVQSFNEMTLHSIVQIIIFSLIGLTVLKKQDL